MADQRFLTLMGSGALFSAVSLPILLHPELGSVLYPFYGSLFIWSDLRREAEAHVIFLFLVTMAGVVLTAKAAGPAQQLAVGLELAGIWLLNSAISLHRGDAAEGRRALETRKAALEAEIVNDERGLKYYQTYEQNANSQIRLRRDLTESAKSLGSTLDGREVHMRLSAILSSRYPNARVQLVAGDSADPLLALAVRTRGPVLVKDSGADARLRYSGRIPFKSGIAVPLKVMKQSAGFLKLESDVAGAFGPDDVRTVDLFSTMAALSLANIQFYEAVKQQATHDPLTQLYSHRAFQTRLQEELLRSGRSQTPLSFILCDIDHFKSYNDRYGHQAGDQLLRTVAAILASFARPVDFPARYGGEEFCLIVPNFVRSEAVDLANRIRMRIEAEPFVFQAQKTNATMSFGVSSFPTDATTPSQIIRVADERLYRAKNGGRNQVVG